MKNTFFHIRYIVLCDHFGDIGFTDCVIGMEERVREKRNEKIWRNDIHHKMKGKEITENTVNPHCVFCTCSNKGLYHD